MRERDREREREKEKEKKKSTEEWSISYECIPCKCAGEDRE